MVESRRTALLKDLAAYRDQTASEGGDAPLSTSSKPVWGPSPISLEEIRDTIESLRRTPAEVRIPTEFLSSRDLPSDQAAYTTLTIVAASSERGPIPPQRFWRYGAARQGKTQWLSELMDRYRFIALLCIGWILHIAGI